MEEIMKDAAEVKAEAAVEGKVEIKEAAAEKPAAEIGTTETMEDYSKELEASFRTIKEGDVLSGSVIDVNVEGVSLDLNYYASGGIMGGDMS